MTDALQLRLKQQTDINIDYLYVELLVGDEPIVDFEYYATDLHALLASTETSGELFILTCWCGEPGCAGLKQGIHVSRDSTVVKWHLLEPQPERWFNFARPEYDATIQKTLQQYKYWLVTNRYAFSSERTVTAVPDSNSDFFNIARRHS